MIIEMQTPMEVMITIRKFQAGAVLITTFLSITTVKSTRKDKTEVVGSLVIISYDSRKHLIFNTIAL